MANEREKKETELNRNRYSNAEQQRKFNAVNTQVERERRKANDMIYSRCRYLVVSYAFSREKNAIMLYDGSRTIF
jgi:hypothetical protein